MTRQTSFQMTEATDRQVDALRLAGFGTTTDIIRIAIDRMAREEGYTAMTTNTMTRVQFQPDMATAEVVSIVHATQRGSDGEMFDFASPQDAAAFVAAFVDANATRRMTGEYTREAVAAINSGDWAIWEE